MNRAHPSLEIYSYRCASGLKTFQVEYLLMQNRHLTRRNDLEDHGISQGDERGHSPSDKTMSGNAVGSPGSS